MGCLRRSKKDRYFAKARELLSKEYDIVGLVRQLRFFKAVATELLTKDQVNRLLNEAEREPIVDYDSEVEVINDRES